MYLIFNIIKDLKLTRLAQTMLLDRLDLWVMLGQ